MDIELRHLRSFVAVAEELNFTRAAKRLFIAQQALSTQIRQLEARVGTKLLERTTRSVELTAAGAELFARSRLLLAEAEAAVEATLAVADGAAATLTVGFVAAVDHAEVSGALDRFLAERSEVDVLVHFGDLLDPTGGLPARDVDVAFVYGPFDQTGLEIEWLFESPMGVAMARTHPLAARTDVRLADVIAEPTFDFPANDPEWRAFWNAADARGGRAPAVVAQYRTLEGLLAALRAGLGVSLATPSLIAAAEGALVWKPLDELAPLRHGIARRADDDRAVVHDFVAAVAQHYRSPEVRGG